MKTFRKIKGIIGNLPLAVTICFILLFSQCLLSGINKEPPGFDDLDPAGYPDALLNPERGWYRSMGTDNVSPRRLDSFRYSNVTMVLFETDLGAYLRRPLDEKILDEIDHAFSAAREAGLSVIFRAAYDFEGESNPEPENIRRILEHIGQLKPVFHKNEDILFNVQAGFLGPWGEWHSSRFGNNIRPEVQRQVADALLEAVPESVTVALRRPEYIRSIAGNVSLTGAEAFGNSRIARLAFHNDALMSDESDMGTYSAPNYSRRAELVWVNNHTRYTPMVAETNMVSDYNDAQTAIEHLNYINIQSLNIDYHPDVLDKWRRSYNYYMSAYDYIGMMLGYRFLLKRADLSESAGSLRLDLELMNVGFGCLLKKKNFELVLKRRTSEYRAAIAEDARFWDKNEPVNRTYYFQLPSDIPDGDWDVYLGLSSSFESLANNPAYSVRFVNSLSPNKGIWDANLGLNKIGTINLTAPGDDSGGKEFIQITR